MENEKSPRKMTNTILYNRVKNEFSSCIDNDIKTIILVGSGGNGKSHLTHECANEIESAGYHIVQEINMKVSVDEFKKYFESLPPKKILHFNQHPSKYKGYLQTQNSVLINMNHIHF
tara:strand:+ start:66 stop:416 length:351 start_codon:yes stop_codon:yes gene_type:complete